MIHMVQIMICPTCETSQIKIKTRYLKEQPFAALHITKKQDTYILLLKTSGKTQKSARGTTAASQHVCSNHRPSINLAARLTSLLLGRSNTRLPTDRATSVSHGREINASTRTVCDVHAMGTAAKRAWGDGDINRRLLDQHAAAQTFKPRLHISARQFKRAHIAVKASELSPRTSMSARSVKIPARLRREGNRVILFWC